MRTYALGITIAIVAFLATSCGGEEGEGGDSRQPFCQDGVWTVAPRGASEWMGTTWKVGFAWPRGYENLRTWVVDTPIGPVTYRKNGSSVPAQTFHLSSERGLVKVEMSGTCSQAMTLLGSYEWLECNLEAVDPRRDLRARAELHCREAASD